MSRDLVLPFSGTTALVTGAASGIGAAVVDTLVAQGITELVLVDINEEQLDATAARFGETNVDVLVSAFDIADERRWADLRAQITERFGGLDYAVANAGISGAERIADTTLDGLHKVMGVNVDGAFLTVQTAMGLMREHERPGSIVVVASTAALSPLSLMLSYAVSKSAALQLAQVAAKDGASDGIRVNAILPGGVETPIWQSLPAFVARAAKTSEEEAFEYFAARSGGPTGHFAKPTAIAEQISFLLSDTATNIVGAALVSDGGFSL